jgi:hypothetical protein
MKGFKSILAGCSSRSSVQTVRVYVERIYGLQLDRVDPLDPVLICQMRTLAD